MIFTSYFGRMSSNEFKLLAPYGVNIARHCYFWKGRSYPLLAPNNDVFTQCRHDKNVFRERFISEQLSRLDARKVLHDLGDKAILLCYEKEEDLANGTKFCHRRIVAEWLEKELGVSVPELNKSNLSLFSQPTLPT